MGLRPLPPLPWPAVVPVPSRPAVLLTAAEVWAVVAPTGGPSLSSPSSWVPASLCPAQLRSSCAVPVVALGLGVGRRLRFPG